MVVSSDSDGEEVPDSFGSFDDSWETVVSSGSDVVSGVCAELSGVFDCSGVFVVI